MTIREYSINESIIFKKTKEDFGGLSNMAAGYSLNIYNVIIPTAEHLYQACRFPYNPEVQWAIINEKSPMNAKWVSRKYTHLTRPDWESVRFKIMQWVLEVKLSQNWESFSSLLMRTENKPIVEASTKDKVWGAVKKNDVYSGTNALGRLLMFIRNEYVYKLKHKRCVKPLTIPDFLFLGHSIELICIDEYSDHDCTDESHYSAYSY